MSPAPAEPRRDLSAVPFDERFRDASWAWLQDPELRWIVDAREQTREEQLLWFASLGGRSDYFIWGVEYEGEPAAVFGLKNFSGNGAAEWFMYIGSEEFRGRGIGDWMEGEIQVRARDLGLTELWGWVRPENQRVLRLHRRHGFHIGPLESNGRLKVSKTLTGS